MCRSLALLACPLLGGGPALGALSIIPLRPAAVGQVCEFRVDGVPVVTNTFDPEAITVDAVFVAPSGSSLGVGSFWYQDYARSLSGSNESLRTVGSPEWRIRFTPRESGPYRVTVSVRLAGQPAGPPGTASFVAAAGPAPPTKFVGLATNRQYLAREDGSPLPLVGHCVCWHGSRGTYDYDTWFTAMRNAGENYARLWMCPWAFGIENPSAPLTRYRLDRAWQLDYVFGLAEQHGIYLMLCLDYHGMFETQPDYWGGNNYWPQNPYNAAQGGPCATPNAFFTNTVAQAIYQKRLRYLVARYAASPALLAWQFFNEIDNEYRHLNPGDGAVLAVWVDGARVFTKSLPNLDGTYLVNNEYNTNFTVNLPAGMHTVEVRNGGGDWFYLDWVEFANVLPAEYAGGWQPEPVALGLTDGGETLLYVAHPDLKYPASVAAARLDPVRGASVALSNWPAGPHRARWYDARTGMPAGQSAASATGGLLVLPLPELSEDLTGRLLREPALTIARGDGLDLEIGLQSDPGVAYELLSSMNLLDWSPSGPLTNATPRIMWQQTINGPAGYYQAHVP